MENLALRTRSETNGSAKFFKMFFNIRFIPLRAGLWLSRHGGTRIGIRETGIVKIQRNRWTINETSSVTE